MLTKDEMCVPSPTLPSHPPPFFFERKKPPHFFMYRTVSELVIINPTKMTSLTLRKCNVKTKNKQWRLHQLWQHNRGNYTTPKNLSKKKAKYFSESTLPRGPRFYLDVCVCVCARKAHSSYKFSVFRPNIKKNPPFLAPSVPSFH